MHLHAMPSWREKVNSIRIRSISLSVFALSVEIGSAGGVHLRLLSGAITDSRSPIAGALDPVRNCHMIC
jgi:hypothetical protein